MRAIVLVSRCHRDANDAASSTVVFSPALQTTFTNDDPTEHWSPLPLIIDRKTLPFHSLAGWTSWVALGMTGDSVIRVRARNIEPDAVRLVVIDDLEPYLADDGLPR